MILPPWLWRLVHSRKFWILLIGTPVLGLVLFYAIANAWGARKLEEARKELSAKGYALTWKEVLKSAVAPEEDLLRHAVMVRKPIDIESDLLAKGYDQSRLDNWIPDPAGRSRFSAAEVCGRPAAEEAAAIDQLTNELVSMEPTASEIKAAVRTSKGIGWKVSRSVPIHEDPSISTVVWMSKWTLRRAVLRAAAGDDIGAMDDLRVIHEYLGLLHSEPRTLLSTIIGRGMVRNFTDCSWQIAQMQSTKPGQLQEISRWLGTMDNGESSVDCYQLEAISMNEIASSIFGNITALPPEQMYLVFNWMDVRQWRLAIINFWRQARPVGLFKAELAEALERIDSEILHLPDGSKRRFWTMKDADRIEAITAHLPRTKGSWIAWSNWTFDDIIFSVPSIIRADLQVSSLLRLCRSGIAAELFRRDHGRLPLAMGDLVPAYLAEVPVDPSSESPIRIEATSEDGIFVIAKDEDLWIPVPQR